MFDLLELPNNFCFILFKFYATYLLLSTLNIKRKHSMKIINSRCVLNINLRGKEIPYYHSFLTEFLRKPILFSQRNLELRNAPYRHFKLLMRKILRRVSCNNFIKWGQKFKNLRSLNHPTVKQISEIASIVQISFG